MPFHQFDASAVVKLYVVETGSAWASAIADPASGNVISIADITRAEVASALARRTREGIITPAERDDLIDTFQVRCATQFRLVPTDFAIIDLAIDLARQNPLRAYDAVQLATGIAVNGSLVARGLPPIIFVTADDDLITPARAEGMTTENPNEHPP